MPQYSALFDHHGRVRPAWYAFRLLGQLEGPRYPVAGEQGTLRAIAGEGDCRKHLLVWRYEEGEPIEVRVQLAGAKGRPCRVVALDPAAAVNNLKVLRLFSVGSVEEQAARPLVLTLGPWEIRWIEIE